MKTFRELLLERAEQARLECIDSLRAHLAKTKAQTAEEFFEDILHYESSVEFHVKDLPVKTALALRVPDGLFKVEDAGCYGKEETYRVHHNSAEWHVWRGDVDQLPAEHPPQPPAPIDESEHIPPGLVLVPWSGYSKFEKDEDIGKIESMAFVQLKSDPTGVSRHFTEEDLARSRKLLSAMQKTEMGRGLLQRIQDALADMRVEAAPAPPPLRIEEPVGRCDGSGYLEGNDGHEVPCLGCRACR